MPYVVLSTDHFEKKAKFYNIPEEKITELSKELKVNPNVGKPLGYKFLRERRYNDKRIYFLVYEDLSAVLLVSVSDKKTQENTIEQIKFSFDEYKLRVKRELMKTGN